MLLVSRHDVTSVLQLDLKTSVEHDEGSRSDSCAF